MTMPPPSPNSLSQQVYVTLGDYLRRDPVALHPEDSLRDDLGLDSLQTIELVYQVESVFDLQIPDEDQHYWSPEFHVTVEKIKGNGSLVRGVIGPKPKVWTMFMFFYSAVIVLLFLGISMSVSQWVLGMDAPFLWSIPACAGLWITLLIAAKFGQFKGHKQMERLWHFLNE